MTFDVSVPDLSLVLEYQGEQHYHEIHALADYLMVKSRDNEKREQCKRHNLTLIEVPYWWDFNNESLAATIQLERPDLFPNPPKAAPIPTQPPIKRMLFEKY